MSILKGDSVQKVEGFVGFAGFAASPGEGGVVIGLVIDCKTLRVLLVLTKPAKPDLGSTYSANPY